MKRITISIFCLLLAVGHASAFDPKNKKPPQPAALSTTRPLPPPVPTARKPAAANQPTETVATIVAAPAGGSKANSRRPTPATADKKQANVPSKASSVRWAPTPAANSLSPSAAMRRSEELKNETAAALAKLDELNRQVAERAARRKAEREAGGF